MLINAILDRLAALPLRDIISITEEGLLEVNGKVLNYEEARLIKESASALRDNRTFGLIQDAVLFRALTYGVNSSTNFDQIYFSKAAVWWGQRENELVKLLADYNPRMAPKGSA